jgi:hypothetical protein
MLSFKLKYLFWLYIAQRKFPEITNKEKIGKYPLKVKLGEAKNSSFGSLLEYRVWEHCNNGKDICHFFDNLKNATWHSFNGGQYEQPIALVEEEEGKLSEWAIDWLPTK